VSTRKLGPPHQVNFSGEPSVYVDNDPSTIVPCQPTGPAAIRVGLLPATKGRSG
jgi:hypothetical protein